ncbi:MAG: DNA-binding protein [Candidatus Eisenbacteria bacterium]|nr:DNA-binding protein [Candidatus Eisenbacteria bacterium]
MQSQTTRYGFAVKIESGEEIIASLADFATENGLRAGLISGLGAVLDPELGFFIRDSRSYIRRVFEGEFEIGALTGNFSELEGRPFPHCHVVIGGSDFTASTGHLFRGVVSVTCEVQITTDPGVLRRESRPDLGFNPLALG